MTPEVLRLSLENVDFRLPTQVTDDNSVTALKSLVFEPLLRWQSHGRVEPGLFDRWERSPDARIWQFHIREDACFHDGEPCKAKDIVTYINGLLDSRDYFGMRWSYSRYFSQTKFSAEDDRTVKVTNAEPFADIEGIFCEFWPSRIDKNGKPVLGTGPFRVIEFERKDSTGRAVLQRLNPTRHGSPHTIIATMEPNAAERLRLLRAGEVDAALNLERVANLDLLNFDSGFRWGRVASTLSAIYYLNCTDGIFTSPDARLAVNLALDNDALVKEVYHGFAKSSATIVSPYHLGFPESQLQHIPYDPDRARDLLKDFDKGTHLVLRTPVYMPEHAQKISKFVASSLEAVGFQVEIKVETNRPEYARQIGLKKEIGSLALFDSTPNSTFRVLDDKISILPDGATVDLSKGYIPLLARYTFEDKAAQGLRKRKAGDKSENPIHFSALELVRDNSILLLTGPSGSGKTTFAKHLCHSLASSGFSNARPLPRNDLGDIKEENWGASRLSPCYFSLSGTESLKRLADVTIPQLLGASGSQHEHLLIVLDDLQTAGDELISVLAKTLALIRERTYTKLLLLGDTDVLDRWSFSAVVRHELLPLLECQRREAVRSHLNLDPSTIITTGMGEAASSPAMFALAVQANHSGNCAEELLDAWLSSTHSQPDAASLLAERSYKLIFHSSLTTGPTEMSLTAIQPNPALRSLTVQRLLAARHLADLTPQIAVGLFRDQPHASDDVLRSCLSRLSSLHGSGVLVDGLLGGTPADAKRAALLVAGLIPLSAEVENKVMKLLLEIVENGDCSAGEREKAGRLLSKSGDPRDLTELAEVPAGSFMMGSESHPNSQPLSRVSLERFRIGVYPVVNRDYAAFVKETSREWLSPGGKDPEKANAPATDLTWHDSRAYCQWLTERWREEKKISSNEHVRLPSEPEWECAARGGRDETGTEGLAFPWGTDWQEHTANSDETGFNTTCAVGLFPRGLSPYGCHDMAGHVWEWCSTLWGEDMTMPAFQYPWRDDGRESLDASNHVRRVLRGGCFSSPKLKANCTYRGSLEPTGFWRGNGFRIVVAPLDSQD
ncbi:serine/threonine protein kinase [Colletotrichum costaricense]|uniref:Serine/threonine protein kinase n=1 Tax=Colletotrichum costaricense TaxID=1209916 RepID=A0AAI9YNI3_9PEZI|nr:serine/threonine protein kinase [Colletotrichum costaricense]KAK1517639.1 serine/threonine protein kinase [Colletotrichum costaricense]